jgi:hypothetical protein
MGGIAHLTSLPVSFGVVTGLILVVGIAARRLQAAELSHAPAVVSAQEIPAELRI